MASSQESWQDMSHTLWPSASYTGKNPLLKDWVSQEVSSCLNSEKSVTAKTLGKHLCLSAQCGRGSILLKPHGQVTMTQLISQETFQHNCVSLSTDMFCIILKGTQVNYVRKRYHTPQSLLGYGDGANEVHEGCLELRIKNFVCSCDL